MADEVDLVALQEGFVVDLVVLLDFAGLLEGLVADFADSLLLQENLVAN